MKVFWLLCAFIHINFDRCPYHLKSSMFCRQGSRLRPKHDVKTSLVQFLKIPNFYPLKVSCAFPRNHKMTLYHLTSRLLTIVTKICYSFMIFFLPCTSISSFTVRKTKWRYVWSNIKIFTDNLFFFSGLYMSKTQFYPPKIVLL